MEHCTTHPEYEIKDVTYVVTFAHDITRGTYCIFQDRGRKRFYCTSHHGWSENPESAHWLKECPKEVPYGLRIGQAEETVCGRYSVFEVPPF